MNKTEKMLDLTSNLNKLMVIEDIGWRKTQTIVKFTTLRKWERNREKRKEK